VIGHDPLQLGVLQLELLQALDIVVGSRSLETRYLVALGERNGALGRLGRQLARELDAVFGVLHQPGRDRSNLRQLREDIATHRERFHDLLATGAPAAVIPRPAGSAKDCSITRLAL
jgi:hypothetical protein